MASDPILEARFPLGDAADLIGYHRSPHGAMVHDDAIAAVIGHYGIKVIGEVQLLPADVWQQLPPTCRQAEPWRNPWTTEPVAQHRDLISIALIAFGVVLALVAYSALLIAITKGWIW